MADKAKLAIVVAGCVMGLEIVMILVLALTGTPVPDQCWSLVYATLGVLGGVLGAQALNGKVKNGRDNATETTGGDSSRLHL